MAEKKVLPFFSFVFGASAGFVMRDELTMPTYMRIKMATIEHRMLSKTKLKMEHLSLLDPNEGQY